MQFNRDDAGVMHKLPKPSVDTGMGLERAHRGAAARAFELRDRPVRRPARRGEARGRRRRRAATATRDSPSLKVIADHIRACSLHGRRRRDPGQRGPRLRAAPDHAARDPPRLQARRAQAVLPRAGRRRSPPRWATPTPSCAASRQRVDRRAEAGGGALLPDDRQRHGDPRGGARRRCDRPARGRVVGRRRLQAARHLRLPARPDRRRLPRARRRASTRRGFDALLGEQRERRARPASSRWRRGSSTAARATTFHGYDALAHDSGAGRRGLRRRHAGRRRRAPATTPSSCSTTRRSMPRAAARSATPASCATPTARIVVEDTIKVQAGGARPPRAASSRARSRSATSSDAQVDAERRAKTMRNHSATHLMHKALREVLGEHVQQKGSLVDAEKTRFDFAHNAPLTDEQIRAGRGARQRRDPREPCDQRARDADRRGAASSAR